MDIRGRDPHVQVLVQLFLRLSDEEISDLLGDSVAYIPNHNLIIVVDTGSQFLHKTFLVFPLRCWLVLWWLLLSVYRSISLDLWRGISNDARSELFEL